MTPVSTILIVEGRKPSSEYLAPVLNDQGYCVVTTHTRKQALVKAQELLPAVIVLDVPSLRFDTRRFCEALREADVGSAILVLSAEGEKTDRSLKARAYLRHPFSAKKLVNRVKRLLPVPDDEVLKVGSVILNLKQRSVVCDERESHLTPRQARLLEVLMRHPGDVLTRAFLMKQVWNTDYVGDTRTLEVHIHWVRKAIERDPDSPLYLRTVRRIGYCFEEPQVS